MPEENGKPGRKYKFHWSLIGDLEEGRPNLGLSTRVEVYRLMQFTFRDVIESRFGTEIADQIFYEAGQIAGKEFYDRFISEAKDLSEFVKLMQDKMRDFNIGLLRVEAANEDASNLVLSVAEDLDCSGLPELDYEVCKYDEGFISGAVESFTGQSYDVKEIDCWCTGDRTCRFTVDKVQ
ncbi:MAG: 4-vinyl reductase [Synergistaceae bacterium]|jgi:predicted hydrocarbon binding protein|nr:4-vinyl reductase [Synergistaceae bacterium]